MPSLRRASTESAPPSRPAPNYLFFEEQDHLRRGPDVRCFPPIRDRDEVEALWGCVADGTLDMVTSDHSPFLPADRAAGQDNVWLGQPASRNQAGRREPARDHATDVDPLVQDPDPGRVTAAVDARAGR